MSPYADNDELRSGLTVVAAQIRAWLDWDKRQRDKEPHLTTDDGTSIMALPVPFWPTHGAFENWIKLFQQCHDALDVAQAPAADSAIAALADRLWRVHPREIQDLGITRSQFYEREIRAALKALTGVAQAPSIAEVALREAIDVFEGMNDDEIDVELLPRLRAALSKRA
jgi:hypothetical protein